MGQADAIVIGAGVVGLAIARALARNGQTTLVLEREAAFGTQTSSRNSEVIHAGIYYPTGSLKARLCVAGRQRLYDFCAQAGVPHRRIGKLIVAFDVAGQATLDGIAGHAADAGVSLLPLDRRAAQVLEPALRCQAALLSPETGIIDSHALMVALLGEAEALKAQLVCNVHIARITSSGGAWQIWLEGENAPVVRAPLLVNAAGLGAQAVAGLIEGLEAAAIPPLWLARGQYFAYHGRVPFSRLIYPVPVPGGLGTHLTLGLDGSARFGPDVEWIGEIDYTFPPGRAEAFAIAAKAIWPGIDVDRLHPAFAGIRPKASGPGEPNHDFVIDGPESHGLDGLVNLFAIESPGLTASLAIAELVVARLSRSTWCC